jgi:S1-C subfamily serine protease
VIAGEEDTTVSVRDSSARLDATPVHYDSQNDLAVLRVGGLDRRALKVVPAATAGTSGAVLGYPENGSLTAAAARVGSTVTAVSQDSYGRGPIRRPITSLRGRVRSGNSGGPLVDGTGSVLTTVFAATRGGGPEGGYGVPNAVVRDALRDTSGEADTGPCT